MEEFRIINRQDNQRVIINMKALSSGTDSLREQALENLRVAVAGMSFKEIEAFKNPVKRQISSLFGRGFIHEALELRKLFISEEEAKQAIIQGISRLLDSFLQRVNRDPDSVHGATVMRAARAVLEAFPGDPHKDRKIEELKPVAITVYTILNSKGMRNEANFFKNVFGLTDADTINMKAVAKTATRSH